MQQTLDAMVTSAVGIVLRGGDAEDAATPKFKHEGELIVRRSSCLIPPADR